MVFLSMSTSYAT